ncbi:riboflavin synthase alpha chain [Candidatus Termititenax dinenymphae]|uniref:Riboflavin synthase n=1 Tax=Candidatus Termititenax dinenymphae TaxID=2218523 RepID=A0A388TKG0_9BACT|nr:riboflavin synthase alpha chain [Candidatus Termititenax dinenymphae]
MFTGIIEEIGRIKTSDKRLEILAPEIAGDTKLGDSVAVNGVCLTVAAKEKDKLFFDVMELTLQDTMLGSLQDGAAVNLERALRSDGRFGGHFVSGHVDEAGLVQKVNANILQIKISNKTLIAVKGSVTVNGVSLTVQSVEENLFTVSLVPHTLQTTTLGSLRTGDSVNIEYDLLLRYLQNLIMTEQPKADLKRFLY